MNIVLFCNGTKALLLAAGKDLFDCPLLVRHWLGTQYDQSVAELTLDTPIPGTRPPTVLAEIIQRGFCALDMYGVVHTFETPPTDPLIYAFRIRYGAGSCCLGTARPSQRETCVQSWAT